MNVPDHPEIARTLATGYPRIFRTVYCTGCGAELSGGHKLYRYGGELLCGKCFRGQLLNNVDTEELAEAFDIESVFAGDFLAEEAS